MAETNTSDFVGYCGLYCNACGIRQQKIKNAVTNLRGILAHYGFDKMMPELAKWEPSLKHYAEFDQVMTGLIAMFGDCPGCLHGGGDPSCKVRICAKEKGYRTCAECEVAETCEFLEPYRKGYAGLNKALLGIKKKGVEKYAEEMQRTVNDGYSYVEEKEHA